MNLPRCPGRPRGPKHVRAACMREPRDPSQQLDVIRPVRSCRELGHGWDVFGIWMNGVKYIWVIESIYLFYPNGTR